MESAVGGFWHGPGREGKRAHDEASGQGPRGRTAAWRGRVNTSPKGRAVRGATPDPSSSGGVGELNADHANKRIIAFSEAKPGNDIDRTAVSRQ